MTLPNLRKLLIPGVLSDRQIAETLAPIGFLDAKTAHARMLGLCVSERHRKALTAALPMLFASLQQAATPDTSIVNLERFAQKVPDSLELLKFLSENPRAVEILIKLFVNSQFLTGILLRSPEYLERLTHHKRVSEFKSREEFLAGARSSAESAGSETKSQLDAIRRFQHWELLRIGACDSFGLMDFKNVTVQLSLLADSVVQSVLDIVAADLAIDTAQFSVLAFGKLGGEELNYSSDIDLLFLVRTDAARFWELGQRLIRGLMDTTSEGFLYRVDMRLRPWGNSGALVTTIDGYADYLQKHGALWEKQALLKARPVAGNLAVGVECLQRVTFQIFDASVDDARENVRLMKQKIEAELKRKGKTFGEVKSGQGSIRDIEFITQFLQLRYGRTEKNVRSINTLDGLVRLADFDCLLPNEYRQLSTGYVFLRKIEHALQLLHYKQIHSLPDDERELQYLARRLDFPTAKMFLDSYRSHCADVRKVYEKYIEQKEAASAQNGPADAAGLAEANPAQQPALAQHAATMAPSYARVFAAAEIDRHSQLLEQLSGAQPVVVEAVPDAEGRIRLTVCGYDETGDLTMICGLLFAYGFDIVSGYVFTAESISNSHSGRSEVDDAGPGQPQTGRRSRHRPRPGRSTRTGTTVRPRFVDAFVLEPPADSDVETIWADYQSELIELIQLVAAGQLRDAQGRLARRVAGTIRELPATASTLRPVEIVIDNEASERFTLLKITAEDTPGFLYELANSLSLLEFNIHSVTLTSVGDQAIDTLLVSGPHGEKVTDSDRLSRLRAAVVFVKHFTHLLPRSPSPELALPHFGQFLEQLFDRPDWAVQLASLNRREVLEPLTRLLGISDFLWEDFLRLQHDNLLPVLGDVDGLAGRRSRQRLMELLNEQLAQQKNHTERCQCLNDFKDREMFRIDMRHIAGRIEHFGDFSEELTDLTEAVVAAALRLSTEHLATRHGTLTGTGSAISVLALGKAGGRELGFASDIELLFVYQGEARTNGPEPVSAVEYYQRLVEQFTHTISSRRKGIFEVDLRLRPYGSAGPLAVAASTFAGYFAPSGAAWPYERQALVKLRPIAGDKELGRSIIALRDRVVFNGAPFDWNAMRAMRERQINQPGSSSQWNAKLGPGGLVDCEYLVQALQIEHGYRHSELRQPNTRAALHTLSSLGLISERDFRVLDTAYEFLRRLIDALRMVRGDARDLAIPDASSDEFEFLSRRLGYGTETARLHHEIETTSSAVAELARTLTLPGGDAQTD